MVYSVYRECDAPEDRNWKIGEEKSERRNEVITVIMPILNAMPYLTEALASLESQTFRKFEVCLWDNASTDGSVEEAHRWIPERLPGRVVSGYALPLHECLARMVEEAKTEFVARMDGDDVCLPTRFEKQIEVLLKNKALGIVGGQCPLMDQDGKLLGVSHPGPMHHEDIVTLMMVRSALTHPALMFRRVMLLEAGNYRHPKPVEDLELYLRMSECCKFENLDKVVLHYRIHPKSICQLDLSGQTRQAIHVIDSYSEKVYGISARDFQRLRSKKVCSSWKMLKSATFRSGGGYKKFCKIALSPTFTFVGRCMSHKDDFISKVVFKMIDFITGRSEIKYE